MRRQRLRLPTMRLAILSLPALILLASVSRAQAPAGAPVFDVTPVHSSIKFFVKASVALAGKFDEWDATLTFQSPAVSTGVLEIKIQADSVDTGSGIKNSKLKSKDFFDVDNNPSIVFRSTKFVQTSHDKIEVDGDFTIRGVTNPEKLTLSVSHKEGHLGEIDGKMIFDRKNYGMNKGIPFIKIADHVDVSFNLKVKHVSGPQVDLSQHGKS
jgi:polyisoprenoid-binding protein YceI